jgi:hypothetical protein
MEKNSELERLSAALEFCYSIPFIDDVEDFVFESIWSYVKGIPIENPLSRSKKLFDVVDNNKKIGWSAKTLVLNSNVTKECEFVIQRADVFKKATELGFSKLNENSNPQDIGNAVLEHWTQKVNLDSISQSINIPKIVILLKNSTRTNFRVIENDLDVPLPDELEWSWTNEQNLGLQAKRKVDSFVMFRWYKNQKQLFERIAIQESIPTLSIDASKSSPDEIIRYFKNWKL